MSGPQAIHRFLPVPFESKRVCEPLHSLLGGDRCRGRGQSARQTQGGGTVHRVRQEPADRRPDDVRVMHGATKRVFAPTSSAAASRGAVHHLRIGRGRRGQRLHELLVSACRWRHAQEPKCGRDASLDLAVTERRLRAHGRPADAGELRRLGRPYRSCLEGRRARCVEPAMGHLSGELLEERPVGRRIPRYVPARRAHGRCAADKRAPTP